MKRPTNACARAAVAQLKEESRRREAIHSYKAVADLVGWAERELERKKRKRK